MTNEYLEAIAGCNRDDIVSAYYEANGDMSSFFYNITHSFSRDYYLDRFKEGLGDKKYTTIVDSDYPERLKALDCPLPVIVYKGDLNAINDYKFYCDYKLPDSCDVNQMLFFDYFNSATHIGKKLTIYSPKAYEGCRCVLDSLITLCEKVIFHSWKNPKIKQGQLYDFVFSNGKCFVLVDLSKNFVSELRPVEHGKTIYKLLPPSIYDMEGMGS